MRSLLSRCELLLSRFSPGEGSVGFLAKFGLPFFDRALNGGSHVDTTGVFERCLQFRKRLVLIETGWVSYVGHISSMPERLP